MSKHVVDFLVEFEKNHVATATATVRIKVDEEAQKAAVVKVGLQESS